MSYDKNKKGFIYLRDNDWCKENNVLKMGKSESIKDRQSGYITAEVRRGKFIKIIELNVNERQLKIIDDLLKDEFEYLNVRYDACTELYKREIEDKLENFFIKRKLLYSIVNESDLKRINRNKSLIYNRYLTLFRNSFKLLTITPKDYQLEVLNKIEEEAKIKALVKDVIINVKQRKIKIKRKKETYFCYY